MSRLDKVRICMIGAGSLANAMHYPSLSEMEDVEIAALCDLDAQRSQRLLNASTLARPIPDYRQMLDTEKPDGVYCLMPPHHLYDISVNVLQRGHHLFVESRRESRRFKPAVWLRLPPSTAR